MGIFDIWMFLLDCCTSKNQRLLWSLFGYNNQTNLLHFRCSPKPKKMADTKPQPEWRKRRHFLSCSLLYEPSMLWKQADGGCSSPAQSLQGAMAAEEIGLM